MAAMVKPAGAVVVAIACWTLGVAEVAAAATPTPSPPLDQFLAPPPSGDYVELTAGRPGVVEGPFDADQFIALGSTTNAARVRATLQRDGFISGYGRSWLLRGGNRGVVEAVVAFTGGAGAK